MIEIGRKEDCSGTWDQTQEENLRVHDIESISVEIILNKKKSFMIIAYKPPSLSNECFQNNSLIILDKCICIYEMVYTYGWSECWHAW